MCNCALELTLRRRSQFWHSQQPRRTTGSGAGKRSSTPASEPDYSRLQPNADASVTDSVPAQRALGCLPHDELTVWTPETSLFPWRGRLHYEPASAAARGACYLAVPSGLLWRAIQQSGLSMNPWRWLFFYFLKQYFFFFSVIRKCFSLSRILNRKTT